MAKEDQVRNEISGTVSGPSVQAGDVHGDVVMQSSGRSDGGQWQQELARQLADKAKAHSTREEEHGRVDDPRPLPVRWHTAAEELSDHWTNIRGTPGHNDPMSLTGGFTTIRQTYEAVPSGRLVILGRAGAGKTVLAHRLILALLNDTRRTGPVPVLFSLSDWNPTSTALRPWMVGQLLRDHPFLDIRERTGQRGAEALVDNGSILPVLDGFDEVPKQRRHEAINELSRLKGALIVTSRPDEYRATAQGAKALGRTAAIELDDLTLDEAEQYLQASTSKTHSTPWQAVFERLRANPDDTASRNLMSVLTTPLMVMLARTTYNDTQQRHPRELLDTHRFTTCEDLEQRLLGAYTDTLYDPRRDTNPRRANGFRCSPERARRWLGYLATHLQERNTHDLTWWHLPTTLHSRTRLLVITAIVGIAFGLTVGLASVLGWGLDFSFGLGSGPMDNFSFGLARGPARGFARGFAFGLPSGLVFGIIGGLINEVRFSRRHAGREPERLRLGPHRHHHQSRARWASLTTSTSEFTSGLSIGLAFGCALGLARGLTEERTDGLMAGIALGFISGITGGLVNVVVSALGSTYDPTVTAPWTLLSRDRRITLVRTIGAVLAVVLVITSMSGLTSGLTVTTIPTGNMGMITSLITSGLTCGLVFGIARLTFSAWGNWLLFARLWLPLTGRLPWRPKRFLEDAYRRGVLRQAGAVYQFRHARLRDHLAVHYRTAPARTPATPEPASTEHDSATTM